MRITRKGFTLVELLIVIAILTALTASVTINMSGTTAKAKAAAIRANFDTCKTAAMTYYSSHIDESALAASTKADDVMKEIIPGWTANTGITKGVVTYTATGDGAGNWKIVADYTNDTAATEIATLLNAVDGINAVSGQTTKSEMKLIDELAETPAQNP